MRDDRRVPETVSAPAGLERERRSLTLPAPLRTSLAHAGKCIGLAVLVIALTEGSSAIAQEADRDGSFDPCFLGFESEPAMDLGGRTLASIDGGLSRSMGVLIRVASRPKVAAAYEIPFGIVLSIVQHEVNGHGGRAREFGLGPRYGAGFGFSAYTTIRRDPESNEVTTLLAAGGTEADGILAHRILLDLYSPRGGEGSAVPLLLMAKLDLTLYALETAKPERHGRAKNFSDQFDEGNDMAIYLVGRQGQRLNADPGDVWNRDYRIDFQERPLLTTWRDVRATALWNFLDPAVALSAVSYAKEHLGGGVVRIHPQVLHLSKQIGLTVGTRGALGPAEVSRFLDLYLTTPIGVATCYMRDLDSSADRTYGYGIGMHRVRILDGLDAGVQGDFWREPDATERTSQDSRWNASAEIDVLLRSRWGFTVKGGYKSAGFFPGAPSDEGRYLGFGLRAAF